MVGGCELFYSRIYPFSVEIIRLKQDYEQSPTAPLPHTMIALTGGGQNKFYGRARSAPWKRIKPAPDIIQKINLSN